jgi:exodeoxyribonuclease V alpha subunit
VTRINEYKFKIIPQAERYYSENTYYGVYVFKTQNEIPHCKIYQEDIFNADDNDKSFIGNLCGNMQRLYIGSEYNVIATLDFNKKYKSWQYKPKIISAIVPDNQEQEKLFLQSLLTSNQTDTLLKEYPNIVQDVINGVDKVDTSKLKGIGDITWKNIKDKILNNYIISDILVLLQPLGVTFNTIKKLLNYESNPTLLKQKLIENPYIMTEVSGLGFKKVDALAIKINPKIRLSKQRVYAYIKYYFTELGEQEGHTWVLQSQLDMNVNNELSECKDIYGNIIEFEKEHGEFLYFENDKVGLKKYHDIEENTYNILLGLNKYKRSWNFKIEEGIKEAENQQGFTYTEEQINVIKNALKSNVAIIAGKAGTGKTSIARGLLNVYKISGYSIAATAFSAKAAQRITEATGFDSSTIHRLLGAQGISTFQFNSENPLYYDVIFLDEASMVNVSIFYNLVKAIKQGSRLIICGDNRQLPPIGYGNVFDDLLKKNKYFNINQLTHIHRQAEKSGILLDANKIREGQYPIPKPQLKIVSGELQDMVYMFRDDPAALQSIAIKTYLKSIKTDGIDNVVLITPRKKNCPNSTNELNKILQDKIIKDDVPFLNYGSTKYKLGAKVIQRKNNYEKNVFNGEIGYITKIYKDTERNIDCFNVEYKMNDIVKKIEYTRNELDQIELAYALTVHVSQGSGYKTVIVLIDNSDYIMLDSCLLYTAITRAKERCLLLAEPSAFKKCINTNKTINRQTWLELT